MTFQQSSSELDVYIPRQVDLLVAVVRLLCLPIDSCAGHGKA